MAPAVASIMADEMGFGNAWESAQVEEFDRTARAYLCDADGTIQEQDACR